MHKIIIKDYETSFREKLIDWLSVIDNPRLINIFWQIEAGYNFNNNKENDRVKWFQR